VTTGSRTADPGDAVRGVVDSAKQETRSVAAETVHQARWFAGRLGDEVREQAATQQSRVADALHSAGSSFSQMAERSTDTGYAPQLVRAAGAQVDSVATWLGTREPAGVVDEVKRFARRRPGMFIAIAVGAGLVAGRMVRALAAPPDDTSAGMATGSRSSTPFDAQPVRPPRETTAPSVSRVGATQVSAPPVDTDIAGGARSSTGSDARYRPGGGETS